jgi:tRNA(fMet)-specific endonuclease VapC
MVKLKYLLDTNICLYIVKKQPPPVIEKFAACRIGEVALSSVTWAELCCGLGVHDKRDEMMALFGRLSLRDFDMKAAEIFGTLSQKFPNRKSSFDRMIAAHALSLDAILVTNNTADFRIYEATGLRLENWAPAQ